MPPELNVLIPFLTLTATSLVLLSSTKKIFSFISILLLTVFVAADTLLGWKSLESVSNTIVNHPQEALVALLTVLSFAVMVAPRKPIEFSIDGFIILPLLLGISFSDQLFFFSLLGAVLILVSYYQVLTELKLRSVKVVARSAYTEILLLLSFGIVGLFAQNTTSMGLTLALPYTLCVLLGFLYLILQGPILIGLSQAGVTYQKILALYIPKAVVCYKIIALGYESFQKLSLSQQSALSGYVFFVSSTVLAVLSFQALTNKSRETYSKIYVLSQYLILGNLIVLTSLPAPRVFIGLFVLDVAISFCTIMYLKVSKFGRWLFTLQTVLIPVSIVFFAKILIVRTLILESGFHPVAYLALANQVCLSVAAVKQCSDYKVGKIRLRAGHAVYLTCAIISAWIMVILT